MGTTQKFLVCLLVISSGRLHLTFLVYVSFMICLLFCFVDCVQCYLELYVFTQSLAFLMVQSVCISEKKKKSRRNGRGGFSSGFIFLGRYQKKKKRQHGEVFYRLFSPLIQQSKKFSVCISQRKLVSSRNLTEKNIVFHLGFYLKSHFQTKSNANLVICLLPCHHGLICNNKYVSGTTQRGFTD